MFKVPPTRVTEKIRHVCSKSTWQVTERLSARHPEMTRGFPATRSTLKRTCRQIACLACDRDGCVDAPARSSVSPPPAQPAALATRPSATANVEHFTRLTVRAPAGSPPPPNEPSADRVVTVSTKSSQTTDPTT